MGLWRAAASAVWDELKARREAKRPKAPPPPELAVSETETQFVIVRANGLVYRYDKPGADANADVW